MQNDTIKCGLTEQKQGVYQDSFDVQAYVWYEEDYTPDTYQHTHERYQLSYVEHGYQYLQIDQCICLVPQYHVIWIPANQLHTTTSTSKDINLKVVLYKEVPEDEFYQRVHIFPAPLVLREMLHYASKWNRLVDSSVEQDQFLQAVLVSLKSFCEENQSLQIPIPSDYRLKAVCDAIHAQYAYSLNLDELATLATMSVRNLQRIFRQETGITLQKYLQLVRILKSIELIDSGEFTLSEVGFHVGYQSLAAFRKSYYDIMKVYPKVKK